MSFLKNHKKPQKNPQKNHIENEQLVLRKEKKNRMNVTDYLLVCN